MVIPLCLQAFIRSYLKRVIQSIGRDLILNTNGSSCSTTVREVRECFHLWRNTLSWVKCGTFHQGVLFFERGWTWGMEMSGLERRKRDSGRSLGSYYSNPVPVNKHLNKGKGTGWQEKILERVRNSLSTWWLNESKEWTDVVTKNSCLGIK